MSKIPKRNLAGQTTEVTMMELRAEPGEVIDAVSYGLKVRVLKAGKHRATIIPPDMERGSDEVTRVLPDGSFVGQPPITFRRNLGGHY